MSQAGRRPVRSLLGSLRPLYVPPPLRYIGDCPWCGAVRGLLFTSLIPKAARNVGWLYCKICRRVSPYSAYQGYSSRFGASRKGLWEFFRHTVSPYWETPAASDVCRQLLISMNPADPLTRELLKLGGQTRDVERFVDICKTYVPVPKRLLPPAYRRRKCPAFVLPVCNAPGYIVGLVVFSEGTRCVLPCRHARRGKSDRSFRVFLRVEYPGRERTCNTFEDGLRQLLIDTPGVNCRQTTLTWYPDQSPPASPIDSLHLDGCL